MQPARRGGATRLALDRRPDPHGRARREVAAGDDPGRDRGPSALALDRGRGVQRRHRLRLPRRDERAAARGDPGGVRGHRLARAPNAARSAARRGTDPHAAATSFPPKRGRSCSG
jgi:hypothetical protein